MPPERFPPSPAHARSDTAVRAVLGPLGVDMATFDHVANRCSWSQLHADRKAHRRAMQSILDRAQKEGRDLTEAEAAAFDMCSTAAGLVSDEIDSREENGNRERRSAGSGRVDLPTHNARAGSGGFASLGEFIACVAQNPQDDRLAGAWTELRSETSMDSGPAGGFAVPAQFRDQLLEIRMPSSIVRPRAMVLEPGSPPDAAMTMPALDQENGQQGGVEVAWIAEGADKPETDAKLCEVTLTPHEVAAFVTVTDKLLRNWQSGSPVIERLLRDAITAEEDRRFLLGNGIAKPLGILSSAAAINVNRVASNAIKFADVAAMWARLLMRGGTPVWIASVSTRQQLTTMRNEIGSPPQGDGSLIWQPSARHGEPDRLMGRSILWSETLPNLGTRGDLILADLSYYLIKDGSSPFVAANPYSKIKQNKTEIKVFFNVDGQPWLTAPFTTEQSFDVSPFVVLDIPAG